MCQPCGGIKSPQKKEKMTSNFIRCSTCFSRWPKVDASVFFFYSSKLGSFLAATIQLSALFILRCLLCLDTKGTTSSLNMVFVIIIQRQYLNMKMPSTKSDDASSHVQRRTIRTRKTSLHEDLDEFVVCGFYANAGDFFQEGNLGQRTPLKFL